MFECFISFVWIFINFEANNDGIFLKGEFGEVEIEAVNLIENLFNLLSLISSLFFKYNCVSLSNRNVFYFSVRILYLTVTLKQLMI